MSMVGTKVMLRPVRLDDAAIMGEWKNDEQTYMYLGGGYQPISLDQYRKWVENMIDQTGSNKRFIIENMEHQPIGMVGLYSINWIHRTCEIGAFIGDHGSQNRGLATEACHIIEQYASFYLNLRKISLKVVDENNRAKAFWQKLGYNAVGKLRKERFINGKYCDVVIMEKFIEAVKIEGGV